MISIEGIDLPEGNIGDIQDSYKYLGIPQANGNHEEATRKSTTAKYLQRVWQVLKSQLNGKNKVQAINMYALPVIRYPAGSTLSISHWSDSKAPSLEGCFSFAVTAIDTGNLSCQKPFLYTITLSLLPERVIWSICCFYSCYMLHYMFTSAYFLSLSIHFTCGSAVAYS